MGDPTSMPAPAEPATAPGAPGRLGRHFSFSRTGVLLLLVAHALACAGVLALMPGGWPWLSVPFVATRLLPLALLVWIIAAFTRGRPHAAPAAVLITLAGIWSGVAVWSLVLFPISVWRLGPIATAGSAFVALAGHQEMRRAGTRYGRLVIPMVAGLTLAWLPVQLLRAPPASVRPGGGAVVAIAYESIQKRSVKLDEHVRFDTSDGSFTFNVGRRYVQVEPLLSFNQRSPDGCWTIFAPRADRLPPTRTLIGHTVANGKAEAAFAERDHRRTWAEHHVSAQVNADMLAIEAVATLHATTWSHLNTFTHVTVAGHKQLRVKFSGMREPIDVLPLGYPAGAPARFAYMDAVRRLHVVEAHSGEKGPYRDLVPPMPIDGPVMITLLDGDVPFVELTLNDWATQASVAASPTAGWGVPQNAIEFSLIGDGPTSPATFHVTLAATSVGRGWNSVAHLPGQYMNRLDVRWLAP